MQANFLMFWDRSHPGDEKFLQDLVLGGEGYLGTMVLKQKDQSP